MTFDIDAWNTLRICPVAELERMTSGSVAKRLTLSPYPITPRYVRCDRSAQY